jgi:hypothetical protein
MFHFHGSLRSRLMVLVLLSVLPALGLILYSGLEQRRWAASRAQEDALRLVRHACLDQERLVQGATQLLTAIAQLPSIQEPNQASIPEFLRRLLQHLLIPIWECSGGWHRAIALSLSALR